MNLVDRAKNICLTPQTEWGVIEGEPASTAGLMTGYVVPLAAISAIAGFVGGSLIGQSIPLVGTYRVPLTTGLGVAVFTICAAVIGVLIVAFLINALAPTFAAQKDSGQSLKLAVYSFTPAWIAGVFQILPMLGLLVLLGGLYGLYLLYLGLPRLMKCPPDRAVGYTAVVVLLAIVVNVTLGLIGSRIAFGASGVGGLSGTIGGADAAVAADPNSPLGRLQQLGQSLEESARKAETAGQAGDAAGQAAAAFEGIGALLGGGTRVEPVDIDVLKPLVPDTFAGLPRASSSAERTGLGALMVSTAEAVYRDGSGREVRLEITDTGGVSGLMGMASWMGVQQERESDDGYERTRRVNGRMTHEKSSRQGSNEYDVVVGERFMVSARSRDLDVDALRAAVGSLDLDTLESLKAAGVQSQ